MIRNKVRTTYIGDHAAEIVEVAIDLPLPIECYDLEGLWSYFHDEWEDDCSRLPGHWSVLVVGDTYYKYIQDFRFRTWEWKEVKSKSHKRLIQQAT